MKKTQELQKIIGNHRKHKLVSKNKTLIDLEHREDKIIKLNKWDCFKWNKNRVICEFMRNVWQRNLLKKIIVYIRMRRHVSLMYMYLERRI